jgi:hypothetical protein
MCRIARIAEFNVGIVTTLVGLSLSNVSLRSTLFRLALVIRKGHCCTNT